MPASSEPDGRLAPDRQTETDRQTDRQTDRERDRQTDRGTDARTDRRAERQTDRQTERIFARFQRLAFQLKILFGAISKRKEKLSPV